MLKRLIVTATAVGALCVAFSAQAQATRVTRMLVPFAAGGPQSV